jgi:hypothetical protein
MTDYPSQGSPLDPKDHPETNMPSSDYWAGKPASERPAKSQKSNIPDSDPHTTDPWNKSFKPGDT